MKKALSFVCIFILGLSALFAMAAKSDSWQIEEFKDKFGDPTGEYFAYYDIEDGQYTHGNVTGPAKIRVKAWLRNNPMQTIVFKFEIHPENWETPVPEIFPDGYTYWEFKIDDEYLHSIEANPIVWNEFHAYDALDLYKIFKESSETKVYIDINSTEYLFKLTNAKFEKCIMELKNRFNGKLIEFDIWETIEDQSFLYPGTNYRTYTSSYPNTEFNIKWYADEKKKEPFITLDFYRFEDDFGFVYFSTVNEMELICGDDKYSIDYGEEGTQLITIPYFETNSTRSKILFDLKKFCSKDETLTIVLKHKTPFRDFNEYVSIPTSDLLKYLKSPYETT